VGANVTQKFTVIHNRVSCSCPQMTDVCYGIQWLGLFGTRMWGSWSKGFFLHKKTLPSNTIFIRSTTNPIQTKYKDYNLSSSTQGKSTSTCVFSWHASLLYASALGLLWFHYLIAFFELLFTDYAW